MQRKRRTRSRIRTGCPPTAASARRRSYRLCTLRERSPQPGHTAVLPRALASISMTPSTRVICSITTPARCGNRTRAHLESHADQDHPDDANPTGNTRNISTTKCVPEPGLTTAPGQKPMALDRQVPPRGARSPAGVWVPRPGVRSPPDVQNSVRPGGRGLPFLTTHRVPGDSPRRGWRLGSVRAMSGGRQSGGITAASDPAERTSVGRCSVSCSTLIRYAGAAVDRAATAARSPGTGTAIARIPASCSSSAIA